MRSWLTLRNSFEADLGIADTYLAEEDFTEFENFLEDVPVNRDLNTEQEEDFDLYGRLAEVIIAAIEDDRSEALLGQDEIDSLEVIAYANDRRIARVAKNILEAFYGYEFDDTYENRGWKINDPGDAWKRVAEEQVDVYPNPSSGNVIFEGKKSIAIVEIYGLLGAPVRELDGLHQKNVLWDIQDVKEGLYVYRVLFTDGTISSDKLRLIR
ncbi:MAG TPA: T9SS type A sorting domain-containing protein [Saprospiraceae bacterium]|nr:T9SS type A sorting domain-containing protein [Saprospiraceae bacterium]